MDANREIIRYLLDLLGICNLKKLKYQKSTSMSIFCIVEIYPKRLWEVWHIPMKVICQNAMQLNMGNTGFVSTFH